MTQDLTRRNAIAAIAILTAGAATPAAAAALPVTPASDPVIKLLADYRKGSALFEEIQEKDWTQLGGEDAVIAATYGPPYEAISEFEGTALTRQGAIEALRFILKECEYFAASPTIWPLANAALGYLENQGA